MLSHGNLISNLLACQAVLPVNADDVALSFLPLSHCVRAAGVLRLSRERRHDRVRRVDGHHRPRHDDRPPTVMTGVPRVYEKFQARILGAATRCRSRGGRCSTGASGRARAARAQGDPRAVGGISLARVRDGRRLVFSKIRDSVGGRLRVLVSGSAPLPLQRRRVLLRHRSADHRRLRPHRDLAGPDASIRSTRRGSARSARRFPASRCGSPRTARFWCGART